MEFEIWYGEQLALHNIPAGILHGQSYCSTVNAVSSSKEIFFLDLGLTVYTSKSTQTRKSDGANTVRWYF